MSGDGGGGGARAAPINSEQLADVLTCPVCLEGYTDERRAKAYQCQHLVCAHCLYKLLHQHGLDIVNWMGPGDRPPRPQVTCPTCKAVHKLPVAAGWYFHLLTPRDIVQDWPDCLIVNKLLTAAAAPAAADEPLATSNKYKT